MGNVFAQNLLIPLPALLLPMRLRLFCFIFSFRTAAAHFALKIRHWLALGCIGSHMCAERISVVWCVLLLTLYFYGAFGWSRYTLLRKARAADDSTVVESSSYYLTTSRR